MSFKLSFCLLIGQSPLMLASDWLKTSDPLTILREHNMLEEKDYAPLEALTARICTD